MKTILTILPLMMLASCSVKSPGFVSDFGRDVEYEEFYGHDKNGNPWGYSTKGQDEAKATNFVAGAVGSAYGLKTITDGYVAVSKSADKTSALLGRDKGLTERTGIREVEKTQRKAIELEAALAAEGGGPEVQ